MTNASLPTTARESLTYEISQADRLLCQLLSLDARQSIVLDTIDEELWIEVFRHARRHQLASVLCYRLKDTPAWEKLPESVRSGLSRVNLQDTATAMARQHRLGQVLKAFSQREIPVIVLKGAYLAEMVYPHISERKMGDIDLLVQKPRIEDAIVTLRSLGYSTSLDHSAEKNFSFHHHAPPFKQQEFPTIELHWELISLDEPVEIDLEGVWQRTVPVAISGYSVLGLSPEDLLLHLCIHITHHRLAGGLRASFDIAMVVNHFVSKIDWDILADRAHQWKAERSIFLMLHLSKDLFGALVSAAFLSKGQPDDFDPLMFSVIYRLVFFDGPAPFLVSVARMQSTPKVLEKLRILMGRFFPPVRDISYRFGVSHLSWRVWLYYPLHWWVLLKRQFKWVWKFWRGDVSTHTRARSDLEHFELVRWFSDWLYSD